VLAVAVFDHGAAPPGVSDRLFRFEYLASASAMGQAWPVLPFRGKRSTQHDRLQAAASTAPAGCPVVVMDTARQRCSARWRTRRRQREEAIVANVGNFHTLAFHLRRGALPACLSTIPAAQPGAVGRDAGPARRRHPVQRRGVCRHGHGALIVDRSPARPDALWVAVTGPRRALLAARG